MKRLDSDQVTQNSGVTNEPDARANAAHSKGLECGGRLEMSLPGHLVSLVGTAISQFPVIVEPLAPSSSFLISEEYGGMRPNWVADNL